MTHTVRQGSNGIVQDQQVFMLILMERKHQGLQDETKVRNQLSARLLLQGCKGWTGGLLHSLVRVQDALQQLRHERLQVWVVRLAHNPMRVTRQGPASDGSNQSLLVWQAEVYQVWDQLGKMLNHSGHAALSDCSQCKDARFFNFPFTVEEGFFEDREQNWKQIVAENACQDVEGCGWTFSEVPVWERAVVIATAFVVACVTLKS